MDQSSAPYPPDSPEARVSDATTYFGLNLMRAVSFKDDTSDTTRATDATILDQQQPLHDKTVVSPLSLQILLKTILLGAADQSLSQAKLAKVLGYGDVTRCRDKEEDAESTSARLAWAHEAMHNVVESVMKASRLPSTQEVEPDTSRLSFTMKNLMLVDDDTLYLVEEYLSAVKRFYPEILCVKQFSWRFPLRSYIDLKRMNWYEFVNMWAKKVTNDQLTGSADDKSGLFGNRPVLTLASAAHFKAHWLHAFDPSLTHDRTFYNRGQFEGGVKAKFMHQTGLFGYCEIKLGRLVDSRSNDPPRESRAKVTGKLNCRVLSLPLSAAVGQEELSMVILMPLLPSGLDHIIENLTVRGLNQIYRLLHEHRVDVQLPKFTIETSHDAELILSKLGLSHLFGAKADLGPMQGTGEDYTGIDLKVDKIIQMTKVEVYEQGAGTATQPMANVARAASVSSKKKIPATKFTVDRPFLFVIRHNRSSMPLFIGQVTSLPDTPATKNESAAPPSDSLMTVGDTPDTSDTPHTPEEQVSQATTKFGLDLLRAISSTTNTSDTATATHTLRKQLHEENTVVSPLSLRILLNIILLGAKDQSLSQAQLAKVLGYGDETKCGGGEKDTGDRLVWAHKAMHNVVDSVMKASRFPSTQELQPDASRFSFTLENLMLINNDIFRVDQEYLSALKKNNSKMLCVKQFSRGEPLSSSSTGEEVSLHEYVNMWLKEVTDDQITGSAKDEPSLANQSIALALVSATHLRARWLHAFDPSLTQDRNFYSRGHFENGVTTKFMCQTGLFGYGLILDETDFLTPQNLARRMNLPKRLNCQVLSLPFLAADGQEELSMVILLPVSPGTLDELFEELTAQGLDMLYRTLAERLVSVQLPKFNIEVTHDAEPILSKLGVLRIFGAEAELDPMQASEEDHKAHVEVDKIIQKAKIEVNEHGVGATVALTAPASRAGSIDSDKEIPDVCFFADRPFLYIIRHNRSGMPLFMGQVTNFLQPDQIN